MTKINYLKYMESNTRDLVDTIKRPNLQIIATDKGELHTKVIENNVDTAITEFSPNIEKGMLI